MKYMVIGATGYIGSYLFTQLKKDGHDVIGTSRRRHTMNGFTYYDIRNSDIRDITSELSGENVTAIICVAEASIDRCYEDYESSYDINVRQTKKLIRTLSQEGIQSIFFSSDSVFDGTKGNYTEESPANACNQYGKMKAEMEQYLLANESDSCILRIPKTVNITKEKQNILTQWAEEMKTGTIRCIKGNKMSFIYMKDIYQACLTASKRPLHGLYHIAGDQAYTRAELAKKFCDKLGVSVLIQECPAEEFAFKDIRPLDISMSNLKWKKETGCQFIDMDSVIEAYVGNCKEREMD